MAGVVGSKGCLEQYDLKILAKMIEDRHRETLKSVASLFEKHLDPSAHASPVKAHASPVAAHALKEQEQEQQEQQEEEEEEEEEEREFVDAPDTSRRASLDAAASQACLSKTITSSLWDVDVGPDN